MLLAQSRPAAPSQPQLGTAIIIAIMATIIITTIIATTPIILATTVIGTGIATDRARQSRRLVLRLTRAAGGGESSSRQPPYNQDDYDEDSNFINVAHGVAIFSPIERPHLRPARTFLVFGI